MEAIMDVSGKARASQGPPGAGCGRLVVTAGAGPGRKNQLLWNLTGGVLEDHFPFNWTLCQVPH